MIDFQSKLVTNWEIRNHPLNKTAKDSLFGLTVEETLTKLAMFRKGELICS